MPMHNATMNVKQIIWGKKVLIKYVALRIKYCMYVIVPGVHNIVYYELLIVL